MFSTWIYACRGGGSANNSLSMSSLDMNTVKWVCSCYKMLVYFRLKLHALVVCETCFFLMKFVSFHEFMSTLWWSQSCLIKAVASFPTDCHYLWSNLISVLELTDLQSPSYKSDGFLLSFHCLSRFSVDLDDCKCNGAFTLTRNWNILSFRLKICLFWYLNFRQKRMQH